MKSIIHFRALGICICCIFPSWSMAACNKNLVNQAMNSDIFKRSIDAGGLFIWDNSKGTWGPLPAGTHTGSPGKMSFLYTFPKSICNPEENDSQIPCEPFGFISIKTHKPNSSLSPYVYLEHGEKYQRLSGFKSLRTSVSNYQAFHGAELHGNTTIKTRWHQSFMVTQNNTIKTYIPVEKKTTFLFDNTQLEKGIKKVRLIRFSTPRPQQFEPVCVQFGVTWNHGLTNLTMELTLLNPVINSAEYFPLKYTFQTGE